MPMVFSKFSFYFKAFSTFLEWVLSNVASPDGIIHYLDDFLITGPAVICAYILSSFSKLCKLFGIPLAHKKQLVLFQLLNSWALP